MKESDRFGMSEESAMSDVECLLSICTTADGESNDHLCTLCAPVLVGERKTCDRCLTATGRFWTWFEVVYGTEVYGADQRLHVGTFKGIVALLSGTEDKVKGAADNLDAICAVRRRERHIIMYAFGADFCKRTLRHLVDTIDNADVLASIVRDAVKEDYEKRRYHLRR